MVNVREDWENRMEPEILYEDENIVAINKPVGLVVHGDGPNHTKSAAGRTSQNEVLGETKEKTLADWLLQKYPKIKNVGENALRPGIVHRLDKETSGVMLVAKTQKAFEILKKQFQNREIEKIYHAFVFGEMSAGLKGTSRLGGKKDEGTIDRPIGRSSKDFRMWSAQRGARGLMREAVTDYRVISRKDGYSFVEVRPKTGRTHQIRVHFKAINYPLVADSLYAPSRENSLGFKRLALHSQQITFKDVKGVSQTVTAPYPEDFAQAVNSLQSIK